MQKTKLFQNKPTKMTIKFLGIVTSSILVSCEDPQKNLPANDEVKPTVKQEREKTQRPKPEHTNQQLLIDEVTEMENFVDKHGLDSISLLFSSLDGDERQEKLRVAFSFLVKDTTKSQLLIELAKLPASASKHVLISQAIIEGQGDFEEDLLSTVSHMEYPDEKETALSAYSSTVLLSTSQEFENAMVFIRENTADSEALERMNNRLVERYVSSLVSRTPREAVVLINQLPEVFREQAVELTSKELGTKSDGNILPFADSLKQWPSLQKKAYLTGFQHLGRVKPSKAISLLDQIDTRFQADAISGLVGSWITDDPSSASEWAAKQTGTRLEAAARAVVKHLEDYQAPDEEIAPWRKLYSE